jgi:iron(III) transport system ATP-binding protein
MGRVLWKLSNIHVGAGPRSRLRDVSVEVREGVTAVIGQSGAGKTTLLNLLVGFEKADRGEVDCRVAAEGGFHLPVFWSPQDGGLWPHVKARRHLEIVKPRENGIEEMSGILAALDIAEKAQSHPGELSQGEQARLSIARALAARPAVLVLDEPFSSIDPGRMGKYWDVVREHVKRTGASLVFATHSPKAVLAEADRVICLKEGRVLYDGEVEDLYWRPATRELAECLGETNWLEPEELQFWLKRSGNAAVCLRPEQVAVEPARESPLIVKSSRFHGSVAEVVVEHSGNGHARRFYHRPFANTLRPGDSVVVKALLFMLALLLVGCSADSVPALAFREVNVWKMPPDGPRIPAPRSVSAGLDKEIIVLDTAGRVLIFNHDGEIVRQWRMPDTEIGNPEGACLLKDGRIAVADTHYNRVVFFDQEGNVVCKLGRRGEGPGEFGYPVAITQDDRENIYVSEYGSNDRIQKFSKDGEFITAFGGFGTEMGEFQRPSGLVWKSGRIYVADAINARIQVFSDTGDFIGVLDPPEGKADLQIPYDITAGRNGEFYVIEYGGCRISRIDSEGRLLGRYGAAGTGIGEFRTPWGILLDSTDQLIVADTGNRRVVGLRQ